MRIRWTSPAADDLEDIKHYLDINYPRFSLSTVTRIYNGILSLKSMPMRGRIGLKPGTRELLFYPLPYIVSDRLTGEVVEIVRIFHGARNRS